MDDYIKREYAKRAVCGLCRYADTPNCEECEHPIDDIPAADVRENVRGEWIHWSRSDECSVCGYDTGKYEAGINFCPYCGADMRGEKE